MKAKIQLGEHSYKGYLLVMQDVDHLTRKVTKHSPWMWQFEDTDDTFVCVNSDWNFATIELALADAKAHGITVEGE